ncbi:site-specific integrase [Pedobacter nanyangensis]|uniref:site-specific integrase n=1 Tax=Pedobacter nanyangensis TaxID=1562389 RepID=UPI000DE3AC82|nr:site-specific integrase [Pedobacter nanyangensis]
MRTNLSVLFFLKKPKNYRQGNPCFIYLRITVDSVRSEMSTGRSCDPEYWNSKSGKVVGNREEIRTINAYLEKMRVDIFAIYTLMTVENLEITSESIKCRYLGKEEKSHTLLEAIKVHNEKMDALVEKEEYAKGTLKRFEVLERHIKDYLNVSYGKNDINVKNIDHSFIDGFDHFLHVNKENDTNTANKHLKNLKKIVSICRRYKWITTDPFFGHVLKSKPVHREYLTSDELQKITKRKFSTERLSRVRDFFLFSCYTGLSYADVQKLRPSDIGIGVDGERWIFAYRKKTDTRAAIPLLPIATDILDRYHDHPYCANNDRALPISSNQKMNEYLIEIAALCGINKILGNRIAKRTFATTVTLMNGVPIESVSKMLGHTNIRTTQLYAKVLDVKVSRDMAPLKKKYTEKDDISEAS